MSGGRRLVHSRQITFQGYERDDGLFEVEGRLLDTKADDFLQPANGRVVPAGTPIHRMTVVLVVDQGMTIREVRTEMLDYPYPTCPGGGDTLQAMVGATIGPGWTPEVRRRLPACDTCSHLREILTPMATAVYQTMVERLRDSFDARDAAGRPRKLDSCHAYGAGRALAASLWPEHARPPVQD